MRYGIHRAPPEVVLDGVTGKLARPGSVDELARNVIWAIEHPTEARRMAREGRRRFADRFRIETMVSNTERLYQDLLAAPDVRGRSFTIHPRQ